MLSLLFSSAITSFLTGITEPLEFSFLFASPLLYFGVHCILGGLDNVETVTNCATRLRVELKDGDAIDEALLKSTGAAGIFKRGTSVQVVYGPKVGNIRNALEAYMETLKNA